MKIIDSKKKYILNIDLTRNVVYEKPTSYWKQEDLERLHNEYATVIIPLFKGVPWRKCCDLRAYKISMITEHMQHHVNYCWKNGYVGAAVITDDSHIETSAIELQMKIATKYVDFDLVFCKNIEEADAWLNKNI